MLAQNKDRVIEFLNSKNIDIDFSYFLSNDEFESAEDIREILDNANAFDVEIIYYSRAMEYLTANDNSLRESLEIASDMGYEVKNLTSEILASLLASQNVRAEFNDIENELQELIEEIMQEEAEEESEESEEA